MGAKRGRGGRERCGRAWKLATMRISAAGSAGGAAAAGAPVPVALQLGRRAAWRRPGAAPTACGSNVRIATD